MATTPSPELKQKLAAVTKARAEHIQARNSLAAQFREQLKAQLAEHSAKVDLSVREAYDTPGANLSLVKEAYGTKDHATIKKILNRTPSLQMVEVEEAGVYTLDATGNYVDVNYVNHGPAKITGQARFEIIELEEGEPMFAVVPNGLDTRENNDAIRVLDGVFTGDYYEEAASWLATK